MQIDMQSGIVKSKIYVNIVLGTKSMGEAARKISQMFTGKGRLQATDVSCFTSPRCPRRSFGSLILPMCMLEMSSSLLTALTDIGSQADCNSSRCRDSHNTLTAVPPECPIILVHTQPAQVGIYHLFSISQCAYCHSTNELDC